MRNLTCIVCPLGCTLAVEEGSLQSSGNAALVITGNRCRRGIDYAKEEISAPKRIVTATCGVCGENPSIKRIPVKTSAPCPKEKIPELLRDIYSTKIKLPVSRADVIIAGWKGTEINISATRTVL